MAKGGAGVYFTKMKILITGIAGAGKTTIINELIKLGEQALDLDNSGTCAWINKKTGEETAYKEGAGKEWIENHRWQVIPSRLIERLSNFSTAKNIYVGGKVARIQLEEMSKIFDKIFLLNPYDNIVDSRLASRTSNKHNFAKSKDERDHIVNNRYEFEKECLRVGAIPLNNHGTVKEIVEFLIKQ